MIEAAYGATDEPRRPRRWLAALLSFLFPGLGQAYAGRWTLAAVLALPVLLLIIGILALMNGFGGPIRNALLSSGFLVAVIIGNLALFAWRAFAIADAGLRPPVEEFHERRITLTSVAILIVITIAMHAWVGVVVAHLDDTLRLVFGGTAVPNEPIPDPSGSPGVGDPVNVPSYRWDGTDRINVLLLGTDAHETRDAVLTDVILVVSIDPVDETAVMISVPRDSGFVPLPDTSLYADGLYPDKVNGLSATASLDPETWCPDLDDGDACGLRVIERSIGLYLGIEIHHYALVDMAGFAQLIDAVGGLRLCLPGELHDPEFDGSLDNLDVDEPLVLPAGCHEYNGLDALAYARSRKGWIEMADGTREPQTDFTRNERQQAVLLALRNELAQADLFFELPDVLRAIGRSVSTDFPRDQAGDLASLLPFIAGPDIERVVLAYPDYVDLPTQPEVNYLLVPKRDAIREEMARTFGEDELTGWYLGSEDPAPEGAPAAEP